MDFEGGTNYVICVRCTCVFEHASPDRVLLRDHKLTSTTLDLEPFALGQQLQGGISRFCVF